MENKPPSRQNLDKTPEYGTKFVISVQDAHNIHSALENKDGKHTIANVVLDETGTKFYANIESNGGHYDILYELGSNIDKGAMDFFTSVIDEINDTIGFEIDEVEGDGSTFIINALSGKARYVLTYDYVARRIRLTTGYKLGTFGNCERIGQESPKLDFFDIHSTLSYFNIIAGIITDEHTKATNGCAISSQEVEIKLNGGRFEPESYQTTLGGELKSEYSELLQGLMVETPNVSFDEIGGQDSAIEELKKLATSIAKPEVYSKWGTRPPKGILLHGPPGTGKTLAVKALATQANATFINIRTSDINSKWHGESEGKIRQIFEEASKLDGKVIIFFDELDSIMPNRDGSVHEVTQKVINEILQSVDGLQAQSNITVIGATNRFNSIDPAMVRSGRLDRKIEMGLPDYDGRKKIFEIHMYRAETLAGGDSLFDNIDLEKIAELTESYNGADIAEIIRRTLEDKAYQDSIGLKPTLVSTEDILAQLVNFSNKKVQKPREFIGFKMPNNTLGK